jgi:nitrogenase subunit NifH
MTTTKNMGIWMDHASANLMEVTTNPITTTTIEASYTHQDKQDSLHKSENLMHNKEQQQQEKFYRQIAVEISKHENVLLFGPTNAKTELLNMLRADQAFSKINIEVKDADKMTENQQQAFVKEHFSK